MNPQNTLTLFGYERSQKLLLKTNKLLLNNSFLTVTYTDSLFILLLFMKAICNTNTNPTRKELVPNLDYL